VDVLECPLVVDHNLLGGRIIIIIIRGYLGNLDKAKSLQQVVLVDKTSNTERFKVPGIGQHRKSRELVGRLIRMHKAFFLRIQNPKDTHFCHCSVPA
jgi:hypothetical protein